MHEDDRARWDERHRAGDWIDRPGPAAILTAADPWLPASGRALDLACGTGRNALFLARRGLEVTAIDISGEALSILARKSRAEKLPIHPLQGDLERFFLPPERFDVVVSTRFLLRGLFGSIRRTLATGGLLVFETYNVDELEILGGDLRRAYVLQRGELRRAFRELDTLAYEEGIFDTPEGERGLARLIARKRQS